MGFIRAFFRRGQLEETLDDEIRRHIDLQTEEYINAGLSKDEARRAAFQRFGHVGSVKERCREQNGLAGIEMLSQDLKFAARSFAGQPGFTAVLMITLALGIGANTAVFSVLRAVLLDPIPLPEPDRVVLIWEQDRLRGTTRENASYPDYLDLKQSSRHFTDLAATQSMDVTLTGNGEAERVAAARVTHEFFKVLGLTPTIGRVFGPGEDGVVLSHSLWERKFASSTSVLGTVIRLDGFSGTVVGVLPAEANSFRPRSAELWTSLENVRASQFRGQHSTGIIGRLQRSSSITQAQAEISVIMSRLEKDFPDDNLGRGAKVVPLHEELAGNMRPALQALFIAVFVLLLIASVNIANLLLARASSRNREMAIRVSLGAGRWRLARQLLTESLFLAIFGVALGVITAWWGVRGLIVLAPPDTPLIGRAGIDGSVLLMTFAVTLVAWLIFGLLPALRASIVAPTSALQTSGRNTASRSTLRLRHALVIAQIAMAVVLVIFSGLLIRSFWRLRQVNLGYEPQGAISLRVKLPETRYPFPKFPFREWPAVIAFSDRLKAAALETPGVEAVSLGSNSPAHGAWTTRVTVDGRPKLPDGEQKEAQFRIADPDYLKTTRIRLLRGRFFERSDDEKHPLVSCRKRGVCARPLFKRGPGWTAHQRIRHVAPGGRHHRRRTLRWSRIRFLPCDVFPLAASSISKPDAHRAHRRQSICIGAGFASGRIRRRSKCSSLRPDDAGTLATRIYGARTLHHVSAYRLRLPGSPFGFGWYLRSRGL